MFQIHLRLRAFPSSISKFPPARWIRWCPEIEEAGAAVVERSEALFYVDAKMIEELLGAETSSRLLR